jgi:transposase
MRIKLSSEEFSILRSSYKSEKDKTKAERINIILLLHKGYSQKEVSNILNLDEDTVSKWKIVFENRKDIKSWLSTNYVSYTGKISTLQMSQVRTYLKTFKVSDKKEIQSYLADSFFTEYSLSGLQKLLKRIGFSHQTIHKLPGKCPIELQEAWVKNFEINLANRTSNEVILFVDSVHPAHNTKYSKIWTEKGKPRYIESNTGREHLNICGAYNPDNQDVITINAQSINAQTIILLLKKCIQKYPEKSLISIYLDNAKYHKSKLVKEFLATQSNINLEFLPPYSPNLNLIERLWKFANEKVINLKYYPFFEDFKTKILDFYDNIGIYAAELKKRITYNFQLFNTASI